MDDLLDADDLLDHDFSAHQRCSAGRQRSSCIGPIEIVEDDPPARLQEAVHEEERQAADEPVVSTIEVARSRLRHRV
jgi:hypothetical protein